MDKLTRDDLYSLEKYSEIRKDFRAQIMAHKKNRIVHLGPNATLHFEDRLLMQYQVQEMLRAEKIFDAEGIQEELDAYNPLIPDGTNWKATFMIEFEDPAERATKLAELIGIEQKVWVKVGSCEKVFPICNEDLDRETEQKTSSVHFMRFELTPEMIQTIQRGESIGIGVDYPQYTYAIDQLDEGMRASLAADIKA